MSGGARAKGSGLSQQPGSGEQRPAAAPGPGAAAARGPRPAAGLPRRLSCPAGASLRPGSIGISVSPGERPRGTAKGFPLLLSCVPKRSQGQLPPLL